MYCHCQNPYDACCRYQGQMVRIQDKSGREHFGRISRVSKDRVWLDTSSGHRGQNSHNYHGSYDRYGYSYYGGFGFSIAIGFIAGIALASLFFI